MRLEDRIASIIIEDMDSAGGPLDLERLRDEMYGAISQDTEDACTYCHQCVAIIDEYETHAYAADLDGYLNTEKRYTADEWQQAQQDYAQAIAAAVLSGLVSEAINELETEAADLWDWARREGAPESVIIMVDGYSCAHGWASHDAEDDRGAMIWRSGQLDGLNGVAARSAGVWLSVIWEPIQQQAEAAD